MNKLNLKKVAQLLIIASIMVSCNNDNSNINYYNKETLVGNWLSKYTLADETLFDINGDGTSSLDIIEELPCQYYTLHLNSDFTFFQKQNTWNYNNLIYSCKEETNLETSGIWRVNNNLTTLTLTINGNEVYIPIEYDGLTLSFRSSIPLLNTNKNNEDKQIFGIVFYQKY